MDDFDPGKVRPQMMAHFNILLGLFEKAGQLGADPGEKVKAEIGGHFAETIAATDGK